jgi:hypothetical protein
MHVVTREFTKGNLKGLTYSELTNVNFELGEIINNAIGGSSYKIISVEEPTKEFIRIKKKIEENIKAGYLVVNNYNDIMYHNEMTSEENQVIWNMLPKHFQDAIMKQWEKEQEKRDFQYWKNNQPI